MSKELIDRELLEKWADKLEGADSAGYGWEDLLAAEIRGAFAQPAEAEGVEVVAYAYIDETPEDYLRTKPFVMFAGPDGGAPGPAMAHQRLEALVRLSALSAVTAERDRLLSENARLIEDRARFPDRPDDIGHMIGSHIGNLKAGKEQAEKYARKWRDNLDSEIRAVDQLRAEVEELRKDSARMDFMVAQRALIDSQNGTASPTVYRVCWPSESRQQADWYPSERDAIDAAMAAKEA